MKNTQSYLKKDLPFGRVELIDGNPSGKHMMLIIDYLREEFKKYPEGKLHMREANVNKHGHVCGSVHCNGGWKAFFLCDTSTPIDYTYGASAFAWLLGFSSSRDYELWAKENHKLWGNEDGQYMFHYNSAFTSKPTGAASFSDILDFEYAVGERLDKFQNPTS